MTDATPRLARIAIFPVKSLGREERHVAEIVDGALAGDRVYAVVDADGDYVNGKRTRRVHRLQSSFDAASETLELAGPDARTATYRLDDEADRAALADRLSAYFDVDARLRHDAAGGFPDDTSASGPTVVSTGTLREAASWYDGIDVAGMRRRLRANLEVDGVPPFWEDRLFTRPGEVVRFEVGDVRLEGVNPCQRCVVPSRDPDTGAEYDGFRETFVRRRAATMPEWSGGEWFDHDFRVTVNTRVPESEWGESVAVGDPVRVLGPREA